MLNRKPATSVDNDGINHGIMAGTVNGSVDNSSNFIVMLPERQKKLPSIIPKIIEVLSEITVLSDEELDQRYKVSEEDLRPFNIPDKITHNNLIKYRGVIIEYSYYGRICEEAFNITDNHVMGSKSKILKDIKHLYNEYKGQLLVEHQEDELDDLEIIRRNADYIIDMVKGDLKQRILADDNTAIVYEDIEDGLIRVLCYAFVECKILEKP
ncbi:hypothetical protein [Marinicrinis sediminis]|uniref:Uncharacterized protein n=1 Tax=Marinicrinis sediminis TaxID=1652465 RepID=A0ABW5R9U0_9BACL